MALFLALGFHFLLLFREGYVVMYSTVTELKVCCPILYLLYPPCIPWNKIRKEWSGLKCLTLEEIRSQYCPLAKTFPLAEEAFFIQRVWESFTWTSLPTGDISLILTENLLGFLQVKFM